MPLTFCLLGSGSKGNALYVESGGSALLVDCGLTCKQIMLRLEKRGLNPWLIKGMVITHEHRDHTAGARVLAGKLRCPLFATQATWDNMKGRRGIKHQAITSGEPFTVGGLQLHPFSTTHDAADPVGYRISNGHAELGLATDLGKVTTLVRTRMQGCRAVIVESNHCLDMLAESPYPEWLKQRVRSTRGHLSNEQGAELVGEVHHSGLAHVVLAHLSETNNLPDLARQATGRVLERIGSSARLHVASQSEPCEVITI